MTPARSLALLVVCALAACAPPDEAFDGDGPAPAPVRAAAPGEWVYASDAVGAAQLYQTGDEASLPVLTLGGAGTLTLAFDLLGQEAGAPLDVSFVHTDRLGRPDLVPSEYLTAFERDDILDYRPSGAAVAVPYVHYEYAFPNESIGFRVSGNYRVRVSRPDGTPLFEAPFYVSEELAQVGLAFGAAVQGGTVGTSIQPSVQVRPDRRIAQFDASQYTVCFARNGQTDGVRCAPQPSLIDLALFQFYLPRDDVFEPAAPLYEFDLGLLGLGTDVVEVDRAARPPTAVLDLDYAEFGGDVRDPVLAATPLIGAVYRDVGTSDTDAQYVDVLFRYVPPGSRQLTRRVYVQGSFNGWRREPSTELAWVEAEGRYEGVVLVKQGRYVYGYAPPPARVAPAARPQLFTAFVYLQDPILFTDRLVAVQSGVAQ
ncbi:type IX secretion system plug protein domain-containing protein [Rubrivirga litoralis]|uniref:DUF5103 domain-containing protein n=1 Tax=Rubrivirga litoralis TaxID=3075598 RepID=A0ABU3BNF1_9BACT|nr:type IX secretion system plug protein domain-containing protein [Rubrivirga sp. F394]MDT0630793.1 DUF5103 domain-containing protein [Rubrivirga sp. F394]